MCTLQIVHADPTPTQRISVRVTVSQDEYVTTESDSTLVCRLRVSVQAGSECCSSSHVWIKDLTHSLHGELIETRVCGHARVFFERNLTKHSAPGHSDHSWAIRCATSC